MDEFGDTIGNGTQLRLAISVGFGCWHLARGNCQPRPLPNVVCGTAMSGDEGALWVDHHQEIVLEAVFEDWDDIRQLRDSDDRLGRRPEEMLVQYDASGTCDYRTSAAAYRRTQVHHGVLDFGDDRFVPSLPLDLFAQCCAS